MTHLAQEGVATPVSPSRLRKRILRWLVVSWREQPTRYDIEALQENVGRVGLVVRVRWVLLLVLIVYSVVAGGLYTTRMPFGELVSLMAIPAVALSFVVIYNSFYAMNYRRLGNIAVWNNLQLALDALVVTVLVYFSGGVNSWFWSMYSLFIIEAAFILPRSRDVWALVALSIALLGGIELLEFTGLLPHVIIPFAAESLYSDSVFVPVRFLWQVAVLAGTGSIATLLVGEYRRELESRRDRTITDLTTGLFARGYFMRALAGEVSRASRYGRPVHVMIIDLDHFGEFNNRFGVETGNRLLVAISEALQEAIAPAGEGTNVLARIGGEEFALLYVEDERLEGAPSRVDAESVAQALVAAASAAQVDDASVTVSLGLASMPQDADTPEGLLDRADEALARAIEAGGHRVVTASGS